LGMGWFGRIIKTYHLANGLADLDITLGVDYGNTGAVIAPVFKSLQTLIDDGPSVLFSNIPNNAAHRPSRPLRMPLTLRLTQIQSENEKR
jgi:hypothetical protein